MEKLELEYLVQEPNEINNNTQLIILLHGYGSNEEDLFSFAKELPENLIVISARAPLTLGFGGFAWYSINFTESEGKFSDTKEAIEAREKIATFITQIQNKYSIKPKKTFLLGFSQGTILSYSIALNYPEKIQKVIALSGYINPDLLPEDVKSKDYSKLDFYISHGSVDQVIPVDWANKAPKFLEALHVKHSYQEFPVGHGVAHQNFYALKQWIEERM
ncbi:MAG TPA: alpha/beta fold hydrolase [Flavobacteriaceae bacterium]|nr:alpha/beta fold hydrolase [Flavobacteriaceae bacterium]